MTKYIVAYVGSGVVFLALDATWLTIMGRVLYRPLLGGILTDKVGAVPAILFYMLYVAGIVFFVVAPSLDDARLRTAIVRGAALGLVAYGTYDLTNMATLRNWPAVVVVVDLAWGMVATAAASGVGHAVAARFA